MQGVAGPESATAPVQRAAAEAPSSDGKPADKRIERQFGFHEPEPIDFDDHAGYVQMFDGVSLNGWDGDPGTWRVEGGGHRR